MGTVLSARLSKTAGKVTPQYPGDLGSNTAMYDRAPDYTQPIWKQLALLAEFVTISRSELLADYQDQAMFYCAMTSGREALDKARKNPEKVLELSRELDPTSDVAFVTIQRLSDALDKAQINQLIARNVANNQFAADLVRRKLGALIIAPGDREHLMRNLQNYSSLTNGASFFDWIFENHYWVPTCNLEATHGVYYGDHAWSINACPEKQAGLAAQYGVNYVVNKRGSAAFEIVDALGRPVSVLDQAWEDSRAFIDFVSAPAVHEGQTYEVRNPQLAALLLTRFMYDQMWQDDVPAFSKDAASKMLVKHYNNKTEQRVMKKLRTMMQPYIKAKASHWGALQAILDQDPHLRTFWETHITSAPDISPEELAAVEKNVLSYLPRGGLDTPDLNKHVTKRRDAKSVLVTFQEQTTPDQTNPHAGAPVTDAADSMLHAKLFEDYPLARLRGGKTIDPSHMSLEQAAVLVLTDALLSGGRAPDKRENIYIYMDYPEIGAYAQHFFEQHDNVDVGELKANHDPLRGGMRGFEDQAKAVSSRDYSQRLLELRGGTEYEAWRKAHHVGAIVSVSDIYATIDRLKNVREALGAHYYEAFSAYGSPTNLSAAKEALVSMIIKLRADGMIIPDGRVFNDNLHNHVIEGVNMQLGLQPRMHSGGKYRFDFFKDPGALQQGSALQLDMKKPALKRQSFADLYIDMGTECLRALQGGDRTANRRLLYRSTARMLQFYQMFINPAKYNKKTVRDPLSGADHVKDIIDLSNVVKTQDYKAITETSSFSIWQAADVRKNRPLTGGTPNQSDPHYDPELIAQLENPAFQALLEGRLNLAPYFSGASGAKDHKAQIANMLHLALRSMPLTNPNDPMGQDLPFTGLLLARGMHCLDRDDLNGLDDEYQKAAAFLSSLTAAEKQRIYQQGQGQVYAPAAPSRHGMG